MPKSNLLIAKRRLAAGTAERETPERDGAGSAPRAAPPHAITLQFQAQPQDVNFGGQVLGGSVLRWIDQAALACASGWSGGRCVIAYLSGIRFLNPVRVGQRVEVGARVILTGRTSMHLSVQVGARARGASGQRTETGHCVIVFVAVDGHGKPRPVPAWIPRTREDKAWAAYAQRTTNLREGMESALRASKPRARARRTS